jgi:dipeptidyl aminopeptidase/acylaminoacyl peptidase
MMRPLQTLRSAAVLLLVVGVAPAAAQRPAAGSDGATTPAGAVPRTAAAADAAAIAEYDIRYAQPPAAIADMLTRDANWATLDAPAPNGRYFLVPRATQLSTLELMSRPTYRLAELEIRPATDRLWHLDTYGINGLQIYDIETRQHRAVNLPANTFISDLTWSPDGARVAFLAHLPRGTEVWTADAATGRASRFSDARVLATIGTSSRVNITQNIDMRPARMLQWTPEGTLLTLIVPADRRAEPARNPVPEGPVMRMTRPRPTPSRTLPNLLRDPHDAALFEHYTRSQLVELAPGRAPRRLGEPRMYESISLSPDGRHVMASFYERPFSFITSYRGFPSRTVMLDRSGALLATLAERSLNEGGGGGFGGGGGAGLRGLAWLPHGAGLTFLRREAGNGADRIMLLPAPFDTAAATVLASSEDPIRSVTFSRDGARAFASVSRGNRSAIVHWDLREADAPGEPGPARRMLVDFHATTSPFDLPGDLWTERTSNGVDYVMVSSADDAVYLRGPGLKQDYRPQPFVDRVMLGDGERTRVFEGGKATWDRPLVALDPDLRRMIVARESRDMFPDSYLWTPDGSFINLTNNVNPFPEIAAARRVDFSFNRRDGLEVQASIALPLGYRDGDRVPALFWTYPREYTTPEAYTRSTFNSRNYNAYPHLTWLRWSDLWLTQGYALVNPDIPIIGENYNDTYISNMVDAMYGAMRAVDGLGFVDMDRIGHGGHSYGAFATANLLAHTPFFRAGIAGDGAYNRSLTPFGFQSERRDLWSAPQTYFEMSPFFSADQINTPLLMYHGADDNNSGTWPMQSERFMEALVALGKEAVLYMYPYESHTPRAIENKFDLWARWIDWFDQHVKGAPATTTAEAVSNGSSNR